MTSVLNYRHYRGRSLPASAIYVGRANKHGCAGTYGNVHTRGPCEFCSKKYRIKVEHPGTEALTVFESEFLTKIIDESGFVVGFLSLRDKPLVCGCVRPDGSGECHAKIIAKHLDALPAGAGPSVAIEYAKQERARLAASAMEAADHGN